MSLVLQDVFAEQLPELHGTESVQLDLLKVMGEAASSEQLRSALQRHADSTARQMGRLEQIFESTGVRFKSEPPDIVRALVANAMNQMGRDADNEVIDLLIAQSVMKTEHLEVAAYTAMEAMARAMGNARAAKLLGETLREEHAFAREVERLARPLLKIAEDISENEVEAEETSEDVSVPDVKEEPRRRGARS